MKHYDFRPLLHEFMIIIILCFLVLIIAANMEYELKTTKQFIT